MKSDHAIVRRLERYENEAILPWLVLLGVEPIRRDVEFVMGPCSVAFMMNNAGSFTRENDAYFWPALTVLYQDDRQRTGSVFTLTARYDPLTPGGAQVVLVEAEIHDVMRLVRRPCCVEWVDPIDGQVFRKFPSDDVDRVLHNAWQLFRGGVLPSLCSGDYRFPEPEQRRVFQVAMTHQINALYAEES